MEERQSEASGLLRITVPPNLTEALMLPIIGLFRQRYPNAHVAVFVTERMMDFAADPIDLSFRVAPVSDPDLVVRRLSTYRHVLVASPSYLAGRPAPTRPGDLADHDLLGFGFRGAGEIRWTLARKGTEEHVSFRPAVAVNDYAALQEAVQLGLGIGELPPILCADAVRRRTLVPLLEEWHFPNVELLAVHAGARSLSRLARLFLDACIEHITGLGPNFMRLGRA